MTHKFFNSLLSSAPGHITSRTITSHFPTSHSPTACRERQAPKSEAAQQSALNQIVKNLTVGKAKIPGAADFSLETTENDAKNVSKISKSYRGSVIFPGRCKHGQKIAQGFNQFFAVRKNSEKTPGQRLKGKTRPTQRII